MTKFQEKVLNCIKIIPKGRVTTYNEVAKAIKMLGSARAVGGVLKTNSQYSLYPCYRVIRSNREIGGYNRGVAEKKRLLIKDGIKILKNKVLNFENIFFELSKKI
jgi:methylated-DNA-[protein]-cysteine S-methyltransferase